jgi:predicted outer membrane repeat protein
MSNANIINCTFTDGKDNDISIVRGNQNITISGVVITNGTIGLYVDDTNFNVTVANSYFKNNSAYNGAGIYINTNNTAITVINTTFENNTASYQGAAIYSGVSNSYLMIASSKFLQNTAGNNGGAIYLSKSHDNFAIINSKTYSNFMVIESRHPYTSKAYSVIYSYTVTKPGASRIIVSFDKQSKIWPLDTFTVYTDSSRRVILYQNRGTATWPGVDVPVIIIYRDNFFIELKGPDRNYIIIGGYFGFRANIYPVYPDEVSALASSTNSLFQSNTAGLSGGAIFMNYLTAFPIVLNAQFLDCAAQSNGGALVLYTSNFGAAMQELIFKDNFAGQNGGAIHFASANYGIMIINSSFSNNSATISGGAVYLAAYNGQGLFTTSNTIYFNSSSFSLNTASNGGALAIFYQNIIAFNKVNITNNTATTFGGGIDLDTENIVAFSNITYESNMVSVGFGGALSCKLRNVISVNMSSAIANTARISGGAYSFRNDTNISFDGINIIERNKALMGGGVFLYSTKLWDVKDNGKNASVLYFLENEADGGSAVAAALVQQDSEKTPSNQLKKITFARNNAIKAGTFLWLCNEIVENKPPRCIEPHGLSGEGLIWINNTAAYGEKYATQATTVITDPLYNVTDYNSILKPGK